MRPLSVLHVVANRWWTGSAAPALELVRALAARGHDVSFGCIRGDLLDTKAREAGFAPVAELRLERTARPWVLAQDLAGLRRVVAQRRVDVVHTHLSHDHWLAAVSLRGRPVKLVRTIHHRRAVHRGAPLRWLAGRTHALIAVSTAIADALRDAGIPPSLVTVIPGAVDPSRFTPDADGALVRAELGLGTAPVVGCVARLAAGRGHEVLVRAMERLQARVPAARLVMVGRGEARPAVETLVYRLGLENRVIFAGYRADDLPRVVAAMDCVAFLGSGSEESCRAALEAMAAGRPVVAARVGALPETVVDGETGWLVDREPEAVADRLAAVLLDPGRARAMGQAARRRVLACFTQEHRAAAVEEVYARIVPGS